MIVIVEATSETFRKPASSWASSIRILWPGSKRQPLPCSSNVAGPLALGHAVRAAVDHHLRCRPGRRRTGARSAARPVPVDAVVVDRHLRARRSSSRARRARASRRRPRRGPRASCEPGSATRSRTRFVTGSAWDACGLGSASLVVVCVPVTSTRRRCGASCEERAGAVKVGAGLVRRGTRPSRSAGRSAARRSRRTRAAARLALPGGWAKWSMKRVQPGRDARCGRGPPGSRSRRRPGSPRRCRRGGRRRTGHPTPSPCSARSAGSRRSTAGSGSPGTAAWMRFDIRRLSTGVNSGSVSVPALKIGMR